VTDNDDDRKRYRQDDRTIREEARFSAAKWVWTIVAIILALTIGGIVLNAINGAGRVASAPVNAAVGVVERTLDPANVIANYEWFTNQYRDIQAFADNIDQAAVARNRFMCDVGRDRSRWTEEDRYRYASLDDRLNGLQAQRARMIERYNARTQQLNRDLFRDPSVAPGFVESPPPVELPADPCNPNA
jgi:hypothetical protein